MERIARRVRSLGAAGGYVKPAHGTLRAEDRSAPRRKLCDALTVRSTGRQLRRNARCAWSASARTLRALFSRGLALADRPAEFDGERRFTYDLWLMVSLVHRTTVWLCLSLAILAGFSPAQSLVICLEPGGHVNLRAETPGQICGCCDISASASNQSPADERVASTVSCCACVDVLVPGSSADQRVEPKPIEFQFAPLTTGSPTPIAHTLPLVPRTICAQRPGLPRPPLSLALIRSVVLLV